jgi:hypothetical protein
LPADPTTVGAYLSAQAGRLRVTTQARPGRGACIEVAYLTDAQRRAYNIADDELALDAGWDEVAHLPHLLEIAATSTTAAIAAAVPVGPAQVAARLAEFGALRMMLRAAQRHSRPAGACDPGGIALLDHMGIGALAISAGPRHTALRHESRDRRAVRGSSDGRKSKIKEPAENGPMVPPREAWQTSKRFKVDFHCCPFVAVAVPFVSISSRCCRAAADS